MTDKQNFEWFFYDDINKDRAILMQTWTIFKLIHVLFLFYLHHFENYGSWTVYKKVKRKQVKSLHECKSHDHNHQSTDYAMVWLPQEASRQKEMCETLIVYILLSTFQ